MAKTLTPTTAPNVSAAPGGAQSYGGKQPTTIVNPPSASVGIRYTGTNDPNTATVTLAKAGTVPISTVIAKVNQSVAAGQITRLQGISALRKAGITAQ
jgi:hypothetical protein